MLERYPTLPVATPTQHPAGDAVPLRAALASYYAAQGLPSDGGARGPWFFVRIGPLRIPLPNPAVRKRALLYHDVHHVTTGYNNVFSEGEMIIAGHEIGVGCGPFVVAWVINLWMLALGSLVTPRRLFAAFVRAQSARSFYHHAVEREQVLSMTVGETRRWLGLDRPAPCASSADRLRFALWCAVAWIVTLGTAALAALAAWGVIAVGSRLLSR